jgi:peptidase M50-like protein
MNETTPESQGVSVEEKAGRDCDRCRVAAAAGAPFVTEINAFGRRRTFCPSCLSARQRRYGFLFIGWNAAGLAVGCSILAFTSLDPLGWTLVNLSLLQIFQLFDTLIHEFGHAFSGRVMGLAVEGVEIGLGPLVWSGRILGYRVKLRSVPLGGLTLLQSKIIRWPRIRWGMMVVAGPLANALLAVSAWA